MPLSEHDEASREDAKALAQQIGAHVRVITPGSLDIPGLDGVENVIFHTLIWLYGQIDMGSDATYDQVRRVLGL